MANLKTYDSDRRETDRAASGLTDKVISIDHLDSAVNAHVVVGDGRGNIGYGSGTGTARPEAISRAIEHAMKYLFTVIRNGGTIPYMVIGKYAKSKVLLKPASEGTAKIDDASVKAVLDSAGIQNVVTKTLGTENRVDVVKATFDALENLRYETVEEFLDEIPTGGSTDAQMQRMIESMTPATPVPLPAHVLQARRNAEARDALLREFGALTSADIGKLAGSKSPNRAALAHRWKSDGRIFAVPHQGANYFPGFQFSEGCQPLPVIADVLKILGTHFSAWELALWFWKNNGILGGERAVDLLASAPERVVAAAEEAARELVF